MISQVYLVTIKVNQAQRVRNKANSLYNGEEYYLQVDSHSQFVDNWDEILINQLESLSCAKPVLTGYPSRIATISRCRCCVSFH